ncbi:unnamed protein product, partial [Mesorhabditis belari]|uniref:Tyrosinase copper-binding domain-containing protein n=1 Tax=Mesorhabditis belari TaxID=2138241 RepID=A0AAF3J2S3_9BILA
MSDCENAPSEALKAICRQIHTWDQDSRKVVNVSSRPQNVALSLPARPSNSFECFDINCICMFLFGDFQNGVCNLLNGGVYRKATRKEWRMMSDNERNAYVKAFWAITSNGNYTELSTIHHNIQISPGAHSGPAFLPWHREFIKRLEIALRRVDPSVSLPYWDSTLESALTNPQDSILFSDQFFGNTQGLVTTGLFANWIGLGNAPTRRAMGQSQSVPFVEQDIQSTMSKNSIDQVLAFTAPQRACPFQTTFDVLEYGHGKPHVFVGGDMFEPRTSTNDPLFWLHHSFVDFIWEMWRQQKQTRDQRSTQYPTDNSACSAQAHFSTTIMSPFSPLTNRDGLGNQYTDDLYEYAPRPSCSLGNDCGSPFLFCDRSRGPSRCASRMKIGGNCAGYVNGEQACYRGACVNGRCVAEQQTSSTRTTVTPPRPTVTPPRTTVTPPRTPSTSTTTPSTTIFIGTLPPITSPQTRPTAAPNQVLVEAGIDASQLGQMLNNNQNGNHGGVRVEPGIDVGNGNTGNPYQPQQPRNPYLQPQGRK